MKLLRHIFPLLSVLCLVLGCQKDRIEIIDEAFENKEEQKEEELTEHKLTGKIIGTDKAVDYNTGEPSYSKNTRQNAFDGNLSTFFASYDRSGTWVGLDLGDKHVITKVGYAPRTGQESRVRLAIIEGANKNDFSDAIPIGIIKEPGRTGAIQYIDVHCSRGFRYVRYMSPGDARCNVAELEFHGMKREGADTLFCQLTNLPTVVINTEGGKAITSKTTYTHSTVYVISDGGKKLLSTEKTGVRGRGNASWDFPKKPYKLKFAEKQNMPGAPTSDKKWTLINNYGDKTLMRNILAFEVSRRVGMSYTPYCIPVDVVMNGEYKGCYQLCDQVEAGKGRVPAKDGYFIEIDAYAYSEQVYFYSTKGIPVTVKEPESDQITAAQLAFIKNYFSQMETAVFSNAYKDPANGYRKYMDLDSFLRNFIVGEFCGNTDTYWSVNMYKDNSYGILYTGPAWDYDLAFENDQRTYPINNINDFIYSSKGSVAADAVRTMVNRIVKQDEQARARLVEIWNEVSPSLQDLNAYVDETAALLDESQQLNFVRWPILGTRVHQNPRAYGSYSAEVNAVKNYISARLTRFDELVKK